MPCPATSPLEERPSSESSKVTDKPVAIAADQCYSAEALAMISGQVSSMLGVRPRSAPVTPKGKFPATMPTVMVIAQRVASSPQAHALGGQRCASHIHTEVHPCVARRSSQP